MDFGQTCRTCLRSDATLSSVFDLKLTHFGSSPVDVIRFLTSFTDLTISCNDELPQQMCSECLDEIARMYAFKLKCEKSNNILKEIKSAQKVLAIAVQCGNESNDKSSPVTEIETFQNCKQSTMNICPIKLEKIGPTSGSDKPTANICQLKTENIETISDSDQSTTNIYRIKTEFIEEISDIKPSVPNFSRINPENNVDPSSSNLYRMNSENIETLTMPDELGSETLMSLGIGESKLQTVIGKGTPVKSEPELSITDMESEEYDFEKNCLENQLGVDECPEVLRQHIAFTCKICNKEFEGNIRDHCLQHLPKPINKFPCPICPKSFATKWSLVRHNKTHTEDKPFKCEICLKEFRQKYGLEYHIKVAHSINESEVLQICNKELKTSKRDHSLRRPKQINKFSCQICSKSFTKNSSLQRHSRTHSKKKPFKCEICSKRFRQKHGLEYHTKATHPNNESEVFQICNNELEGNIPDQHVPKQNHKFSCLMCSKSFTKSANFLRHKKTHSKKKPYKCEICSKLFRQKHGLAYHIKVTHPIKDSEVLQCDSTPNAN